MKRYIIILIPFCYFLAAEGQSVLLMQDYPDQPVLMNPATCGADLIPKAAIGYEKQWLGISRSPSSFYVSGELRPGRYDFYNPRMFINDTRLRNAERVGLGAGVYTDTNGPFRETDILLTYSYHIPLTERTALSFGITAKLNHYGVNHSEINPIVIDDPLINFEPCTRGNTSIGAYISNNEYYAGISAVNLLNSASDQQFYALSNRILFGNCGYRFRNETGSVILEPSLALKYMMTDGSLLPDFHIKLYALNYGWINFSYIDKSLMRIVLALRIYKSCYFAYKYAFTVSGMGTYHRNTHGIMLGMNLGVNRYTTNVN